MKKIELYMTKIDMKVLRNFTIIMIVVAFCMSFIIGIFKMNAMPVDGTIEKPIDITIDKPIDITIDKPIDRCPVEPWIEQMEILKKYLVKGDPNYKEEN